MNSSLKPGIERTGTVTVTSEMAPGHLPVVVLSTPSMIGFIEATCLDAAAAHLEAGETSVGVHVCVGHSGPAFEGEEIAITARLSKIEKRRLTFDVEVRSPREVISTGTHERAVVDASRFSQG